MQKLIDPHVHFISLEHGHYQWLKDEGSPFWKDKYKLQKDVSMSDFRVSNSFELHGVVHIEAGFDNEHPEKEIQHFCNDDKITRNYVSAHYIGVCDLLLNPQEFEKALDKLCGFNGLVGVRHILDDSVNEILDGEHARSNLRTLANRKLHFELQADFNNSAHSTNIVDIFASIPALKFAINHAGFYPLSEQQKLDEFLVNIQQLASLPNCVIKCSGFEMSKRDYIQRDVERCLQDIHKLFGEDRVMLASNYPLTKLANRFCVDYADYWDKMNQIVGNLGLNADKLLFQNAKSFYRFFDD